MEQRVTLGIGLEGLELGERQLVERVVERLRAGGIEVRTLRARLYAALVEAAYLAGDLDEVRTLRAQEPR